MNHRLRLAVALGGLYGLLALLFGILGAVLWADMHDFERQAVLAIMRPRYAMAVLLILLAWLGLGLLVWVLYRAYALAPLRLREQALVMVNSNPALRLQACGAAEIRTLAQVVNALADQRESLQRDVEKKILQAKASVEQEKNRLAALMSELTQSVVVCNLDGRILLYNSRARLQFRALSHSPTLADGAELLGIGRSIYAVFERQLVTHALENIHQRMTRGAGSPSAQFVTTTPSGQLLRVQMTPVRAGESGTAPEGGLSGFVLMLDNVTRSFEEESLRDQLLHGLTEGSRSSLANMQAAVDMLGFADLEPEMHERFLRVVREEVASMSQRITDLAQRATQGLKTRWPLEEMLGTDLVMAAQRQIENHCQRPVTVEGADARLWLKVESFTLLQALTYLAGRLVDEFDVKFLQLRLQAAGARAQLDLIWSGQVMSTETVMTWEMDPMRFGSQSTPLTVRDVVERHGGEMWFERERVRHRAFFRFLLPLASAQEHLEASQIMQSDSRPEYYDFDLFRQTEETRALDERLLTHLSYTVFDTETTGLNPSEGDEIIQIGAARIVNGKLLRQESFEQLVNPGRQIPPASILIHGITQDGVRGKPRIGEVLPAFHAFAQDTVLVAHNAAFDMRFLQVKEASTGIVFSHPVLDTLLLSAVIHPNQESHRLEAIAERLGVSVIGRHTALGDAIVTGEIFLRMIPLLAEQNIHTLGQARAAAARTYYARTNY